MNSTVEVANVDLTMRRAMVFGTVMTARMRLNLPALQICTNSTDREFIYLFNPTIPVTRLP